MSQKYSLAGLFTLTLCLAGLTLNNVMAASEQEKGVYELILTDISGIQWFTTIIY